MPDSPLAVDLYCGLGGWAEGFLAEGYRVVGFDIERHDYGNGSYPGELALQDVLTLHGSQFRHAACSVASPPCQEYSYRAMPWKRVRELPAPSNELFETCFRIQREASKAAGHHVPMVVENVRGAERWVGRAAWHFGSYYLWGDVPALMPFASGVKMKGSGAAWFDAGFTRFPSSSPRRRAASAQIAKIPLALAQHIARVYKPSSYGDATCDARLELTPAQAPAAMPRWLANNREISRPGRGGRRRVCGRQ